MATALHRLFVAALLLAITGSLLSGLAWQPLAHAAGAGAAMPNPAADAGSLLVVTEGIASDFSDVSGRWMGERGFGRSMLRSIAWNPSSARGCRAAGKTALALDADGAAAGAAITLAVHAP